jgi:hypothetical protein
VGEASSSGTETLTIKVFGLKVGVVTCGRDWQLLASTERVMPAVLSCLVLSFQSTMYRYIYNHVDCHGRVTHAICTCRTCIHVHVVYKT